MASRNSKQSEPKRKPTGNPVGRPKGKKAAPVVSSSSENDSDHEYDNIHKDDSPNIGHHLEQGELIDVSESEDEVQPQDNVSKVMRSLQRQQLEIAAKLEEISDHQSPEDSIYDWKKEGLKKQYSVLDRAAFKIKLGISSVDLQDSTRTKTLLKTALDILNDRKKELKIADTSEGWWETVNLYRSHPVAENSEDDRRIRRADKLAKERISAKQKRGRNPPRGRFQCRSYHWQQRDDYPQHKEYPYRPTSSARSQDFQQRNTYVPDRHNKNTNTGSVCYFCGLQGHWQDACPQKGQNRRDR